LMLCVLKFLPYLLSGPEMDVPLPPFRVPVLASYLYGID